jgi:dTDP-4-amino-4,6-dideoxygalactose transaminase
MKVPFLDLKAHHAPIMDEVMAAVREVIEANAFAGGPYVAKFDEEFARYCGTRHSLGVGNGTDALWLSLLAAGVGPGDEVITVPMTFLATAEAISYCGAKPVFVDIDPVTYTMDPAGLAAALTPRTKAIIPVHLFGQTADMDPILAFAAKHGLVVVEDSCQAHGAHYRGRIAGTMGATGCFSFYPGKNLGAMGEAGGIVTNDAALFDKMRILRDHGQSKKYHHSMIGWNGRMDGIQGAILSIKLRRLDWSTERRRAHAKLYDELLEGVEGVTRPVEADYARHVYHIYPIRVADRDAVMRELDARGVGTGIHYPIPVHLQEAYRSLGHTRGDFPVAEQCADEFVSLPMYPELTPEHVHHVVNSLKEVMARREPVAA